MLKIRQLIHGEDGVGHERKDARTTKVSDGTNEKYTGAIDSTGSAPTED